MQLLVTLKIPPAPIRVGEESTFGWLGQTPFSEAHELYHPELHRLKEMLRQLRDHPDPLRAIVEDRGRSKTKLRVLDLLLLASLDPFIARLLGLYYIDGEVLPGAPVDYKVVGLWDTPPPERKRVTFESVTPEEARGGLISQNGVVMFTSMSITLEPDDAGGQSLRLEGRPDLSLRLLFRQPINKVDIELDTDVVTWDWRGVAEKPGGGLLASSAFELTASGRVLQLRSTEPIEQLELTPTRAGTWTLSSLEYPNVLPQTPWNAVRIYPLTHRNIPEQHSIVRGAPPVPVPHLETLRRLNPPPGLNDKGHFVAKSTDVELVCSSFTSVNPTRPTRIQAGYTRMDGPAIRPAKTLTARRPVLWPEPRLIAFWPLAGGLQTINNDLLLTSVGRIAFTEIETGINELGGEGLRTQALELIGRGYLCTPTPPALLHLGPHLALQIWVKPHSLGSTWQTLIDNSSTESFWLGLQKQSNGRFRPQFFLNGQGPFEAEEGIPEGIWSHIAVRYDGVAIRFFINGRLSGATPAPFGRVNPSSRGNLYLGCTPRLRDRSFPGAFRGLLADVQIWQCTYPEPDLSDPDLLAFWPLQADARDAKSGLPATMRGRGEFVPEHPQQPGQRVFRFNGSNYLEISGRPELANPGRQLTLQAWIRPEPEQTAAMLLGADQSSGFCLYLVNTPAGYILNFAGGDMLVSSTETVPDGVWSHISVCIDGQQILFFINGRLAGTPLFDVGRLQSGPSGVLCLGADAGSNPTGLQQPYRGEMADVQLWRNVPGGAAPGLLADKEKTRRQQMQVETYREKYASLRAAWPLDGSSLELKSVTYASPVGSVHYEDGHPQDEQRRVLALSGSGCLEVTGRSPDFYRYGDQLCLRAWVKINPAIVGSSLAANMTILSNGAASFAFGLRRLTASKYSLWLRLNGQVFRSTTTVQPGDWARVEAVYNGQEILFRVNNQDFPAEPSAASLGPIADDPSGILRIGANLASGPTSVRASFQGYLADVEIWTPVLALGQEPLPDLTGLSLPADLIARQMPNGSYQFWTSGIDLFGRLSEKSFLPVVLNNRAAPPDPGGVRAAFIPLRAGVDSVNVGDGKLCLDPGSLAGTDLDALLHYDVALEHRTSGEGDHPYVHRKFLEITAVDRRICSDSELPSPVLTVQGNTYSWLEAGDRERVARIEYDRRLRVTWTWTGTQRLFAPDVNSFKLEFRSPDDAPDFWRLLLPPGGPVGVVQEVYGDEAADRDLYLQPIEPGDAFFEHNPYVPRPGRRSTARYYLVTLPSSRPMDNLFRWPAPHRFGPEDFVPGALVAYNAAPQARLWQHFPVLWHQWADPSMWYLLIQVNQPLRRRLEGDGDPPEVLGPPQLSFARYYPGQRYQAEAMLPDPPDFDTPSRPTLSYKVAVTAQESIGIESERSNSGVVIAVNRRRPPLPPAPDVRIGRADIHGQSPAYVTWGITPQLNRAHSTYQLYRATDSAVFSRDLEQRRLGLGRYAGYPTDRLSTVFRDDPDFLDWLQARFPGWVSGWQVRLFVEKPQDFDLPGSAEEERQERQRRIRLWEAASPVWQAWAERFYPTVPVMEDDDEVYPNLQELADRPGNEAAFGLVNQRPIEAPPGASQGFYTDRVNGAVRNRYLYCLRSQSPALLPSTGWGPSSRPAVAELPRRPRQPVFTRVEAGDRSITLHFALNREPDQLEYRLYRSRNKADVDDLRWWEDAPPDKMMISLPDPRLVVSGNALNLPLGRLPADLVIAAVIGVYRADEYPPPTPNPLGIRPYNYFIAEPGGDLPQSSVGHSPSPPRWRISNLRPIADGTAVVVEIVDEAGETRIIEYLGEGPVYRDEGLLGLTDYYYRLVTVNGAGNQSVGSEIMQARTLEIAPPAPPEIIRLERISGTLKDRIEIVVDCQPGLEIMIQKKKREDYVWRTILEWVSQSYPYEFSTEIPNDAEIVLRIWSRTPNKLVCIEPASRIVRL